MSSNTILTIVSTFVLTAAIVWMFQKLRKSERQLSSLKKISQQTLSVEDVQGICNRKFTTLLQHHARTTPSPTRQSVKASPSEEGGEGDDGETGASPVPQTTTEEAKTEGVGEGGQ